MLFFRASTLRGLKQRVLCRQLKTMTMRCLRMLKDALRGAKLLDERYDVNIINARCFDLRS